MSSTWQGPMVTLFVPGATVNYLWTPWTQQCRWAHCNLGFLCVCVTEVFAKQGKEQERDSLLLEWRHVPSQFCKWHSEGKFLFLPLSILPWLPLEPIPDVTFLLVVRKPIHPDSSVLLFQQARTHGWCGKLNHWVWWGLPESLLLSDSRQYFGLGGHSYFSFFPCLSGASRTDVFLILSLTIHQQWEVVIQNSVGGSLGSRVA